MGSRRRASGLQGLILGVVAFGLVVLSVGSTLYFSGVSIGELKLGQKESAAEPYRHATMTDVRLNCEQRLRKTFDDRLRVMHVDKLSSRYDEAAGQFKIYMEAEVQQNPEMPSSVRDMYVSCFGDDQTGEIVLFQYAGDSEEQVSSDGKEPTNYFGL